MENLWEKKSVEYLEEMESKWNGKKERAMILANGFGNGMEWKRNGNGILASYLWNLSIGILRSFYQFHLEPFHQIPFHSMEFHFPFKNAELCPYSVPIPIFEVNPSTLRFRRLISKSLRIANVPVPMFENPSRALSLLYTHFGLEA